MLSDARARKFNTLLVWKLDRLGRSLVHLVRLLEEFRHLGVELLSFSEGLAFTTTTGKLLFQIISAFAEFERDCIRERVKAGMRNAKVKGKRIGRPPRTYLGLEARKAIAEAYRRGASQKAAYATWQSGMALRRAWFSAVWLHIKSCGLGALDRFGLIMSRWRIRTRRYTHNYI